MAEIFNNFDRQTETRFMTQLEEDNRESAERIKTLMFTFDDLAGNPMSALMLGANPPQSLATAMHGAWVSFARTGDPAATGHVAEWPLYREPQRSTMILDEECRVEEDPMGERRAVWEGVDLPQ